MEITVMDLNLGLLKAEVILNDFIMQETVISPRIFSKEPIPQETLDRIKAKIIELAHILTSKHDPVETMEWVGKIKGKNDQKRKSILDKLKEDDAFFKQ